MSASSNKKVLVLCSRPVYNKNSITALKRDKPMAKIKPKVKSVHIEADKPITIWITVRDYVQQNARQLGAIAIAVVAVVGAVLIWSMLRDRAEQESVSLFHRGLALMAQSADQKTGAQKPDAYEKALALFKEAAEKHGGTQTGKTALLFAGNCSFGLKNYDDALKQYTAFLDAAHGNLQYLRSAGFGGMGYAFEGKGDYKQAAQWFEKQKKETESTGEATLNLARVLELGGDKQSACQQYIEFIEKNPMSGQKQFAQIKAQNICPKKGS
jgi:tetratricopeptide (TPR) repeat protein